ncbi:MAG: hypothetical protein ACI9LM_004351 [Alteromonadaceae bacterium]|jgi:hypothetical protein
MLGKKVLFGLICTGSYISSVMANVVSPAQQLVQLADSPLCQDCCRLN